MFNYSEGSMYHCPNLLGFSGRLNGELRTDVACWRVQDSFTQTFFVVNCGMWCFFKLRKWLFKAMRTNSSFRTVAWLWKDRAPTLMTKHNPEKWTSCVLGSEKERLPAGSSTDVIMLFVSVTKARTFVKNALILRRLISTAGALKIKQFFFIKNKMNFRNFPEPLPEFKRRHAIITGFYSTMVHELSQENGKKNGKYCKHVYIYVHYL